MALLYFVILCCKIQPTDGSKYQLLIFTWTIINQGGDGAKSSSHIETTHKYDPLIVDLCALAMGAGIEWGTANTYMPQTRPVDTNPRYSTTPNCANKFSITYLTMAPIYICPGNHRARSLGSKCGFEQDFFCASWSCETTGDTYWKPSSSWDYITVKRLYSPA